LQLRLGRTALASGNHGGWESDSGEELFFWIVWHSFT
jgi:hypothetical protein